MKSRFVHLASWVLIALSATALSLPHGHAEGLTCAEVFSRSGSLTPSEKVYRWASGLSGLEGRLKAILATTPDKAFDVVVNKEEREVLLEGSRVTLNRLQGEVKRLRTVARGRVLIEFAQLKARYREIQGKPSTLRETLRLAHDVTALANAIVLSKENPKALVSQNIDRDVYQKWSDHEAVLLHIMKERGLIPLATHQNLTIRDINYLLGTPIAIIGMVTERTDADNRLRTPLVFFNHDVRHALQGVNFLSHKTWRALFKIIDTWSPEEQAAAHVLIFHMTHENNGWLQQFKVVEFAKGTWHQLGHRLKTEGYYGEKKLLEPVENLEELIYKISQKIEDTLSAGVSEVE